MCGFLIERPHILAKLMIKFELDKPLSIGLKSFVNILGLQLQPAFRGEMDRLVITPKSINLQELLGVGGVDTDHFAAAFGRLFPGGLADARARLVELVAH
jgi:hypothetical protein